MSCQQADNAMLDLMAEAGTMQGLWQKNAFFFS
jgi:hypothetical protein